MSQDESTLKLFMAHRPLLVKYANDILDNPADAEDVVQMAWGRYEATARQRDLSEPVGYLYRIVRNLAINSYHRRQRQEQMMAPADIEIEETIADNGPTPEEATIAQHELRLLGKALAELPERTRVALEMRQCGGHKFREIAAHLGISVTMAHDIVTEGIIHCRHRVRPEQCPDR